MKERALVRGSQAVFTAGGLLVVALLLGGCASKQKKIVPAENQEESEEMYGEQRMFINDTSQTPSEQAAERHYNATQPVEPAGREESDDSDSDE